MKDDLSIDDLIRTEDVRVLFEPVISVRKQAVIGAEAVFQKTSDGAILPFAGLYSQAVAQNATLALDRFLREKTLAAFSPFHRIHRDLLLFLNFDTSIVDQGIVGSGRLSNTVSELGIHPHNVVIEIMESHVRDVESLSAFIQKHRESGFLFALGGVGSGHSNLNRLARTKPDLLKIDPDLGNGIGSDYYKKEIFKSLVNLSRHLGTLVMAEGLREERDALLALELGVDMIQGPFLPDPLGENFDEDEALRGRITALAEKIKTQSLKKSKSARTRFRDHEAAFSSILQALMKEPRENFDKKLEEWAAQYPSVECLYVLDEGGRQLTHTVSLPGKLLPQRKLFSPANIGADHSSKEYYYLLMDAFVNRYTSDPYISLASGNLCVTLSGLFSDPKNQKFVLCVDFPVTP